MVGIFGVANVVELHEGVATRLVQALIPAERDCTDTPATLEDVSEVTLPPAIRDVADEERAGRAARAARRGAAARGRASSGRRCHTGGAQGGERHVN